MKKSLLSLCFLLVQFLSAQNLDFTHLHLSLDLDTNEAAVHGQVQLAFKTSGKVDSIYLNGVNMEYEKVQLNNAVVKFSSDNKGIWLWPESLLDSNSISIQYTAHPRRGMFFIGWDDETGLSRRQIWTQGQGIDNRHWVPHFDEQTDKLLTEIEVLFDSKYEVVSNGSLLSKTEEGNQTRWHYKMKNPHSSYLMMLAIGKYQVRKSSSISGIPLWQYYYPDRADDYKWYYQDNEEIFNFLQQKIGIPYPWQNYKQVPVQDFQHGAMENTTATIFGDFFLVDEVAFNDRNYTFVNAHELAHQWFGNLVTASGAEEHWLHEGFATYYQWLSEKNLYGNNFFDWERYKAAELVFEASLQDTVPLGNAKAGSARFYQKGAWVLYMLNQQLGNENFDRSIKYYLNQNKFGIVTTDSLNQAIKVTTGRDYNDFFKRWISVAGEPVVSIVTSPAGKGFKLQATAEYLPFSDYKLPVEVVYSSKKGERRIQKNFKFSGENSSTLLLEGENEDMKLKYWVANPAMQSLAKIKDSKPLEILQLQYAHSSNLLDRYSAVVMARPHLMSAKGKWLQSIVGNEEEFHSARAEALRQLVEGEFKDSDKLLLLALNDKDIQLQKAAVQLTTVKEGEIKDRIIALLNGDSYELRVSAMHKIIAAGEYYWLKNDSSLDQPGIPDNKVAITALLYRSAILKDSLAIGKLKTYTSSGYDFLTRINAMQAMEALQYFDEDLAANYFDALFSLNRTLSRNARYQLKALFGNENYKLIIEDYINSHISEWEDFEKRTAERTFGLNPE